AKAVASSANGTSSVARSTGRPGAAASETSSRGPLRREVSTSFGTEVPARRAARSAAIPPPPERQDEEEPGRYHHRHDEDQPRADEDDQRDEHRRPDRDHGEGLELVAPHPPQQALVLLGRDLLRVPRA